MVGETATDDGIVPVTRNLRVRLAFTRDTHGNVVTDDLLNALRFFANTGTAFFKTALDMTAKDILEGTPYEGQLGSTLAAADWIEENLPGRERDAEFLRRVHGEGT